MYVDNFKLFIFFVGLIFMTYCVGSVIAYMSSTFGSDDKDKKRFCKIQFTTSLLAGVELVSWGVLMLCRAWERGAMSDGFLGVFAVIIGIYVARASYKEIRNIKYVLSENQT